METRSTQKQKVHLRKLIDRWTPVVAILFFFLKMLQILKRFGLRAKDNGWRAAMKSYSRMEHSKFSLTVFRLALWSDVPTAHRHPRESGDLIPSFEGMTLAAAASNHLIRRLSQFIQNSPELHWQLKWTAFSVKRERKDLVDIVQAEFDVDGSLLSIVPYLDSGDPQLSSLSPESKDKIHQAIIKIYNETRNLPDKKRPWILQKKLHGGTQEKAYAQRILSATFISFEKLRAHRFEDPHFILRKHPGLGLMNILCRFNESSDEVDLWFQFHHIPVDGAPMQEVLRRLKNEWGVRGELRFPALSQVPKIIATLSSTERGGKAMYHATAFIDFRPFLSMRKKLIAQYAGRVSDDITAVSLLMWGLAHHPSFHDKKFLFPVDVAESPETEEERVIGVALIRPGHFFNSHPEKGFLNFQQEFNRRLEAARERRGESHEMFELYALTTPFIYGLTRRLFPRALGEFIGTVGITIIKDSDLFITPMSEIHADGFLAFGNFTIPTEDGGQAGSVTVRGHEEKIEQYLQAVRDVVGDFKKYF